MKTPGNLKEIMNEADYLQWLKYEEKGERLGAIISNPKCKGRYAADATSGMRKLFLAKRRLLKKYGLL